MKLAKVVMSFGEGGPPTVTLSALGTEFKVVYSRKFQGLRKYMQTTILPEALNHLGEDEDLPDEMECILAEGEVLMRDISHYLSCDQHRDEQLSMLKVAHEVMEKSKVKLPYSTEMTLEGVVVSLSTGLSLTEAIAMGMMEGRLVNQKATGEEDELLTAAMGRVKDGSMAVPVPMEVLAAVVLDYECCIPAITEADREAYNAADAGQTAMSTHPNHVH